jgi:hypothetical protein
MLLIVAGLFVSLKVYSWYDVWSAYGDAERVGTPAAYVAFITKHPDSGYCKDAARAGAVLADQGKYLQQWPDLLRALGQHNCTGAAEVLSQALKTNIADVRVAASESLLRLSARAGAAGTNSEVLSDLDSIVTQASTDSSPVVRANLRCIALVNGRPNLIDKPAELSPYVLAKDASCKSGDYSALYVRP